jgi:hypothetical protein
MRDQRQPIGAEQQTKSREESIHENLGRPTGVRVFDDLFVTATSRHSTKDVKTSNRQPCKHLE